MLEQDGAFADLKTLRTFVLLLGTVARENAMFITDKIKSELQPNVESEHERHASAVSSDYMTDFKDATVAKQQIRHVRSKS